ncbi:MAG: non-homologous end-joining DNA ligase [Acholeplasmataceae bacterium]
MKVNPKKVTLNHPEKVMFPAIGASKRDLWDYYERISGTMLPYLKDRPLTMHRFPDGIEGDGFYMKNVPDYFPEWIETVDIEKKEGGTNIQMVCQTEEALLFLVDQACITPHVWLSARNHLDRPDRMVFDLDPSGNDTDTIKRIALALKETMDKKELRSYVMTTGSKGVHVVVPIEADHPFETVKRVADGLAADVVRRLPEIATLEQRKDKREDKVFLDTLRNAYGQTSVCPYAIRALKGAPVATPLSWQEFSDQPFDPQRYRTDNIFRRLGRIDNPWKGFFETKNDLSSLIENE